MGTIRRSAITAAVAVLALGGAACGGGDEAGIKDCLEAHDAYQAASWTDEFKAAEAYFEAGNCTDEQYDRAVTTKTGASRNTVP